MKKIKALWARVRAHLIEDLKYAHKLWSVRLAALAVLLEGVLTAAPDVAKEVWLALPEDLKATLPENFAKWIAWGLIAASMLARLVKQKGKGDD